MVLTNLFFFVYTMKLSFVPAAVLLAPAMAYTMGGRGGRVFRANPYSVFVAPKQNCGPSSSCGPRPDDWLEEAFATLQEEMTSAPSSSFRRGRTRRGPRGTYPRSNQGPSNRMDVDAETLQRQQKEWIQRAFGLASDVFSTIPFEENMSREEFQQKQQEFMDRAFGIAFDVSQGVSSPRFEVEDTEQVFRIAIDVPGVNAEDIDIQVTEPENSKNSDLKTKAKLTITGKRLDQTKSSVGSNAESKEPKTTKFSKTFEVDTAECDVKSVSAQLNNGVLVVSVPKFQEKATPTKTTKIPVMNLADVETPSNVNVQKNPVAEDVSDESPKEPDRETEEERNDDESDAEVI